jgi:hypothetical protein
MSNSVMTVWIQRMTVITVLIKWSTVLWLCCCVAQMKDSAITVSIKWSTVSWLWWSNEWQFYSRVNQMNVSQMLFYQKTRHYWKKANEREKITTLSADSRLLEKGLSTSSMVRHLWLQYIVWRHKIELRCINQYFEKRAGVGQGILTDGEGSVQLTSLY